jgi:hypothetical protein
MTRVNGTEGGEKEDALVERIAEYVRDLECGDGWVDLLPSDNQE